MFYVLLGYFTCMFCMDLGKNGDFFSPYKTLIDRILQYSRSVFIANKGLNFLV